MSANPALLAVLQAAEAALASAGAAVASVRAQVEHGASATDAQDEDEHLPLRETEYSPRTLRRAIAAGELEASLVGRELRVRRRALEAWVAKKRVPPRELRAREKTPAERAIDRGLRSGALRFVAGGGSR